MLLIILVLVFTSMRTELKSIYYQNRELGSELRDLELRYRKDIGETADTSYIAYKLSNLIAEWPPSKRELFFLRFSDLGSSVMTEKDFDNLATKFSESNSEYENLSKILIDMYNTPPTYRRKILYDTQEIMDGGI
jgi:hypothetical protein